ncbi:hypothetical protein HMPREF2711_07680 [Neisseria sp. HMSC070A01]|nr:hypothetical protein HMPREF2711_07680 [Neisseria sp. HMSC070A01]
MILVYANTDTIQTVAHLADTNKDDLRKLLILMFLQDTGHGLLMQKLVFQVVQLIWNHLKRLKHRLLRRVNEADVTRHAK